MYFSIMDIVPESLLANQDFRITTYIKRNFKAIYMKIFLDSADKEEIKKAISSGLVDGITTNPSLIKKAAEKHNIKDMKEYIKELCSFKKTHFPISYLPISLEVISTDFKGMVNEGESLYNSFLIKDEFGRPYKNVNVKIPVCTLENDGQGDVFAGLNAISKLSRTCDVNATLIMSPEQALAAAKAGAKYVSPFIGRINDLLRKTPSRQITGVNEPEREKMEGFDKNVFYEQNSNNDNGIYSGLQLVKETVEILSNYNFDCEVIAASVRNTREIRECALMGCDIATVPLSDLENMLKHSETMKGITTFKNDVVPEYEKIFAEYKK